MNWGSRFFFRTDPYMCCIGHSALALFPWLHATGLIHIVLYVLNTFMYKGMSQERIGRLCLFEHEQTLLVIMPQLMLRWKVGTRPDLMDLKIRGFCILYLYGDVNRTIFPSLTLTLSLSLSDFDCWMPADAYFQSPDLECIEQCSS